MITAAGILLAPGGCRSDPVSPLDPGAALGHFVGQRPGAGPGLGERAGMNDDLEYFRRGTIVRPSPR